MVSLGLKKDRKSVRETRVLGEFGDAHAKKRVSTRIFSDTHRAGLRLAWLVATLAVLTASLLPSSSPPMRALDTLPIQDKLLHLGAYSLLALLPSLHERSAMLVRILIGMLLLGVCLEFLQPYSEGRYFEVADMVADAGGLAVGLALGVIVRKILQRRLRLNRYTESPAGTREEAW